ncbi:MAG: NAD(P)H-dependent oxidoreductase [Acidobacteriota bacterium]|nr:NAD(P)H-dependent oxidoreductase [Acidobacteriota bacterium]
MNVLAIPGSLRRGSFNRRLLEAAAALAPPEMDVTLAEGALLAAVPPFSQDLEENGPDGDPEPVRELRRLVRAAHGLLIATPEYNGSIPGVLKNLLDWLSRRRPDAVLADKPVAVTGATPGEWGTRLAQNALREVLGATRALVLPAGTALYVPRAGRLFDADGRLTDPATSERLSKLLSALGSWIERCGPG